MYPCTRFKQDAEQAIFFTTFETLSLVFALFGGQPGVTAFKSGWFQNPSLAEHRRWRLGLLCGSLHRPCGTVHPDADSQVRVRQGYEWSFPTVFLLMAWMTRFSMPNWVPFSWTIVAYTLGGWFFRVTWVSIFGLEFVWGLFIGVYLLFSNGSVRIYFGFLEGSLELFAVALGLT